MSNQVTIDTKKWCMSILSAGPKSFFAYERGCEQPYTLVPPSCDASGLVLALYAVSHGKASLYVPLLDSAHQFIFDKVYGAIPSELPNMPAGGLRLTY